MAHLKTLTIHGFKSIEILEDFNLRNLNLLIGGNGAGKSNFVDFFRLLRALADGALQVFINEQGGGDGFFFLGPRRTRQIGASVILEANSYEFALAPTSGGGLQVLEERINYGAGPQKGSLLLGVGRLESELKSRKDTFTNSGESSIIGAAYEAVSSSTVYHFHDTSMLAPMRREQLVRDNERFRPDAANIAAFLLALRQYKPETYQLIRDTVRLIAPFFDDFLLRPEDRGGNEMVRLEWRQVGSDFPFQPNHLSDGTIRFICLATALLQPNPPLPSTIVIDEPELGLHPFALSVLADLIHSAAERTQLIISTQSPALIDYFDPEDLIVVNRVNGRSEFRRLEADQLKQWMDDYSLGELWQKKRRAGGTDP